MRFQGRISWDNKWTLPGQSKFLLHAFDDLLWRRHVVFSSIYILWCGASPWMRAGRRLKTIRSGKKLIFLNTASSYHTLDKRSGLRGHWVHDAVHSQREELGGGGGSCLLCTKMDSKSDRSGSALLLAFYCHTEMKFKKLILQCIVLNCVLFIQCEFNISIFQVSSSRYNCFYFIF